MPFNYRDKPKLSDRFRGKSGEEILNELQSELDNPNRGTFFGSPSWRTRHNNSSGFPRGFPFNDDRNRTDIKSYLEEIAARHPEFADQLKEPTVAENFPPNPPGRKRRGSSSEKERNNPQESSCSNQQQPPNIDTENNLSNFGLRNTIPLGSTAAEEERNKRSMSAPPDNRAPEKPKRFITKCEIPTMNDPVQDSSQPPKPVSTDMGGQEHTQPKGNYAPNVRVIPIQVEGREAPLLNSNMDTSTNFGAEKFSDPAFDARLPRDFSGYQKSSPRFVRKDRAGTPPQHQYAPQYQHYGSPQQHFMPQQHPFMGHQQFGPPPHQQQPFGFSSQQEFGGTPQHTFGGSPSQYQHFGVPPSHQQQPFGSSPQSHIHQQPFVSSQQSHVHQQPFTKTSVPQQQDMPQQHPQQHQHSQDNETDSKHHPPPPSKPEPPKDPLEKVQVIQKDVEELMKQVESFKGNSRSDKEYLMLDELLTRQLLLLDNIDTEGKENVRQARKDTIRSIQRCISTLENKVPTVDSKEPVGECKEGSNGIVKEGQQPVSTETQPTEINQNKEGTPADKESQKMEVDMKENKESQKSQEEKTENV